MGVVLRESAHRSPLPQPDDEPSPSVPAADTASVFAVARGGAELVLHPDAERAVASSWAIIEWRSMTNTAIRPATDRDLRTVREIERAAGRVFRDIGMASVAEDEPPALDVLSGYVHAGRAWVTELDRQPIAYLIADVVDGNTHLQQVSVHPGHARNGHGRALIEHLAHRAVEHGHPALTLTTFLDVPWNGPYYRRCGFRLLCPDEITPGLRVLREHEAVRGLDRWPRGCMSRDLS